MMRYVTNMARELVVMVVVLMVVGGAVVFVNMILMGSNKSLSFSSKKRCNFKDQWSSQLIANNPKLLTYIFVQYTVHHSSQMLSTKYRLFSLKERRPILSRLGLFGCYFYDFDTIFCK